LESLSVRLLRATYPENGHSEIFARLSLKDDTNSSVIKKSIETQNSGISDHFIFILDSSYYMDEEISENEIHGFIRTLF